MNAAGGPRDEPAPDGTATDAAADILGDVRDILGVLEESAAAPGLVSTTIEMAAVSRSDAARTPVPHLPKSRSGWIASACVVAGLAAGYAAGRALAPDPDGPILQYLPVVEHLDVLQEAGSVAFLEEIATRNFPQPRVFPRPGDPAPAAGDGSDAWGALDEAIDGLRAGPFGPETPAEVLADRRDHIEDMDDEQMRVIADRATLFRSLPRAGRHDVIELARALGESDDQRVEALAAAARLWHRWVAWSDPADRQAVVALDREERVEWLDRRLRAPGRMPWSQGRGFGGNRGGPSGQSPEGRGIPAAENPSGPSGTDPASPRSTGSTSAISGGEAPAPGTSSGRR